MADLANRRVFNREQNMTDSRDLLAEYARSGSEAAFRELVNRYIKGIFSESRPTLTHVTKQCFRKTEQGWKITLYAPQEATF